MSMNAEVLAGATETARRSLVPEDQRRAHSRLPLAVRIVMLALCFRVAGATVGFISNVTIPDYQNQGFTVFEQPHPFWDRFARWDSGWYTTLPPAVTALSRVDEAIWRSSRSIRS